VEDISILTFSWTQDPNFVRKNTN